MLRPAVYKRQRADSVANESAAEDAPPPEQDDEAQFESQARAAGITLPRRVRRDPWSALVVIVALIVLAAGIGEVTGWINLRSPSSTAGNYQTQTCEGYPVQSTGAVSAAVDPGLVAWLENAGKNMSAAVGGCFSVTVSPNSGDGYLSLYGATPAEFVATYAPPSAADTTALSNPVTAVPITLGAVAVVYDLPGVPSGLNLTGLALAGIYNGSITSWNDPAIAAFNPGVSLSGLPPITAVHLTGAAASTQEFTEYLSANDEAWNSSVGSGLTVTWPGGTGEASAATMSQEVVNTPGAVGYLELFGAPPSDVGVAQVQDRAGGFASPDAIDTWIAASSFDNDSAVRNGSWSDFSLTGAPAVGSYPIDVLTFAGIYRDLGVAYSGALSLSDASWLLTYIYWLTVQSAVAPLPPTFLSESVNVLNNETYDGTTIVHLENENGEGNETGGETGEF